MQQPFLLASLFMYILICEDSGAWVQEEPLYGIHGANKV